MTPPGRTPKTHRRVLRLARNRQLTVYDAVYLELALREHLSLATLDKKLAGAARAERAPVLGDAGLR